MWENILPELTRESLQKYIRLVVLVACYVLARGYYTNWSKTRQVAQQLARDKKAKQDMLDGKAPAVEAQPVPKVDPETVAAFGWGKKTASQQKQREQVVSKLAEQVRQRQQSLYDAAEDHDIEDLLED